MHSCTVHIEEIAQPGKFLWQHSELESQNLWRKAWHAWLYELTISMLEMWGQTALA